MLHSRYTKENAPESEGSEALISKTHALNKESDNDLS